MAEKKKFLLRIDSELLSALEKWSADEFRSVNGQIEYLLEDAVRKDKRKRQDVCRHCAGHAENQKK